MNQETAYFAHKTAVIDLPVKIGYGCKIWHFTHIMQNAEIGNNCTISQNVFIASGVIIGNNCKIQNNVSVYAGVICEDDVFLGPSMVFTNVKNPRSEINRRQSYLETKVGRGCTIGANATIICGITLGQYSFIGAGAVVTKDVAPYALIIGNPAKQTGWMSEFGCILSFDNNGLALCPESAQQYKLDNDEVRRIA